MKRNGQFDEAALLTEQFEKEHPGYSVDRMIDVELIKRGN